MRTTSEPLDGAALAAELETARAVPVATATIATMAAARQTRRTRRERVGDMAGSFA
jgi:hypothetical protein